MHESGRPKRLIVIVGPSSIHDPVAAIRYATWLSSACAIFSGALLPLMRVHCEGAPTIFGWKGLINDPYMDQTFQINEGLRLSRRLLLDINSLEVPVATEFVSPFTFQYAADLVSWGFLGEHTAASPSGQELVSGLPFPVGFKSSANQDFAVAVNAILSARAPRSFASLGAGGNPAIVSTRGNLDSHLILNGSSFRGHQRHDLALAAKALRSFGLSEKVIIDCGNDNSHQDYGRRQVLVADEVVHQIRDGWSNVLGLMLKSNLVEGCQFYVPGKRLAFGQSVTEPCIGLEQTVRVLEKLADAQTLP